MIADLLNQIFKWHGNKGKLMDLPDLARLRQQANQGNASKRSKKSNADAKSKDMLIRIGRHGLSCMNAKEVDELKAQLYELTRN